MLNTLILMAAAVTQAIASPQSAAKADHVALQVADLDRSVAFYRRYLGLQPIPAAARITTVRWLQAGPFQIHLIGGRTKPVDIPIDVHLAFRVRDLDAVMKQLDAGKVAWSDSDKKPHATQTRRDGVRQLYLQDPDGYWLEVNELAKSGR